MIRDHGRGHERGKVEGGLTLPRVFPKLFAPTVSTQRAMPVVQTRAALVPCKTLAARSRGMVRPSINRAVAPNSEATPTRKGDFRELSRSVMIPTTGDMITDAPA